MSTAAKNKLTEAEYLALEEVSEVRHEFYNGEIFAIAGGSPEHNRIKENISGELYIRFGDGGCQSFSSDQRVKIDASTLYTYPDIAIVCGEPEFAKSDRNSLTNPQAIIVILSPSSELHDRTGKFEHYKKFSSLKEYILVAQNKAFIESYSRQADQSWRYQSFEGLEAELKFSSIPVSLPMAKIYARVPFPSPAATPLRLAFPDADLPGKVF